MRRHTQEVVQNLRADRRRGCSIEELMKKYSLPKTTVWNHTHDIQLSSAQKERLRLSQGGSRLRREQNLCHAQVTAREMVDGVAMETVAPLLLAALYWAEGNKREFIFTNTDVAMLRVFLAILERHWHTPRESVLLLIRITEQMNARVCRKYWSTQLEIPIGNVRIDVNGRQNKSKTKFGICRVVMRKGAQGLKITNALIAEITLHVVGKYVTPS